MRKTGGVSSRPVFERLSLRRRGDIGVGHGVALDGDRVLVSKPFELCCREVAVGIIELMEVMHRRGSARDAPSQRSEVTLQSQPFFARQKAGDATSDLCTQDAHGRESTSMVVEPVGRENQSPSTPTRMGPS